MQDLKQWKDRFYWTGRRIHKGLTLAGGLLGFVAATAGLFFFALAGETDARLIFFAFLPFGGIVWFSTFDKKDRSRSSETEDWDFGRSEQPRSKFNSPAPSIDWFGTVLGLCLSYLSIYLSEVLAVTYTYLQAYPEEAALPVFTDVFLHILEADWASQYIWHYWIGLSFFLIFVLGGGTILAYLHKRRNVTPGRRLTDDEKAKLAYGAVLFTRNSLSYDYLLAYLPTGRIRVKDAKAMLARDWDIYRKQDVLDTAEQLLSKDSIESFNQPLCSIRSGKASDREQAIYDDIADNLLEHYQYSNEELNQVQTLSAWNYDRLVNLLRYAYAAKYITEQEMWTAIDQTIIQAQRDYRTWREYFAAVLLGRSFSWGGDFESNRMVAMKLLNSPNSIYKTYPL